MTPAEKKALTEREVRVEIEKKKKELGAEEHERRVRERMEDCQRATLKDAEMQRERDRAEAQKKLERVERMELGEEDDIGGVVDNDFVIHGPNLEEMEAIKTSGWGGPRADYKDVRIKDAQRLFDASNDQRKVVLSSERVTESNDDSEEEKEKEKEKEEIHKKWAEYEKQKKEKERQEEHCTSYEEDEEDEEIEKMDIEEEKGENTPRTVETEETENEGALEIKAQISEIRSHLKSKMTEGGEKERERERQTEGKKEEADKEKKEEDEEDDGKWGDALEGLYEGTGIQIEKEGFLSSLKKENQKLREELKRKEEGESRRPRSKKEMGKKERSKSRRDSSIEKRAKRPSSRQAKIPTSSAGEDN